MSFTRRADQDRLATLVNSINDAMLEPERWSSALRCIADAIGAHGANFWVHDDQLGIIDCTSIDLDPACVSPYVEHYYANDDWLPPFLSHFAAGDFVTGPDLVHEPVFLSGEFYNDFLKPQDIRHVCGLMIENVPHSTTYMSAFRTHGQANFDRADQELLARLVPHLQRTVKIRKRIAGLERAVNTLLGTLDDLASGIVLIDDHGAILFANTVGQRILAERDGITRRGNELVVSHCVASRVLNQAIGSAIASSRGACLKGDEVFTIPRPSRKRPYTGTVLPVGPKAAHTCRIDPARIPAALVFIDESGGDDSSRAKRARAIYGLTTTETEIAIGLASGLDITQIAEKRGVTTQTIRGQLKSIFNKTETHRQAELVALIAKLAPHPNAADANPE